MLLFRSPFIALDSDYDPNAFKRLNDMVSMFHLQYNALAALRFREAHPVRMHWPQTFREKGGDKVKPTPPTTNNGRDGLSEEAKKESTTAVASLFSSNPTASSTSPSSPLSSKLEEEQPTTRVPTEKNETKNTS